MSLDSQVVRPTRVPSPLFKGGPRRFFYPPEEHSPVQVERRPDETDEQWQARQVQLTQAYVRGLREWTRYQIEHGEYFAFQPLRWDTNGKLLAADPLAYGIGYAIGHGGTVAPDIVIMHGLLQLPHVVSTGLGPINGHALGRYFSRPEVAEPLNRYVLPVVNHSGVPLLRQGWESEGFQPVRQAVRHNGLNPLSTGLAYTRARMQTNPGRAASGAVLFGALISAPMIVAGHMAVAVAAPTANATIRWASSLLDDRFHFHDAGEHTFNRIRVWERPKRLFGAVKHTARETRRLSELDPFEQLRLWQVTISAIRRDGLSWRTLRDAQHSTLQQLGKSVSLDEAHRPEDLVVEVSAKEPEAEFSEPPHAFLRRLSWTESKYMAGEFLNISELSPKEAKRIRRSTEYWHLVRRCQQFLRYPDGEGNKRPEIRDADSFRGPKWYATFRANVSERTHSARWMFNSTRPLRNRELPDHLQLVGEGEGTLGLAAALSDASFRSEIIDGTQRVLSGLRTDPEITIEEACDRLCDALELVLEELPTSTMDDYRDVRAVLTWGGRGKATESKLNGLAKALVESLVGPDRGMIVKYVKRGDVDAVLGRLQAKAQLSGDAYVKALVEVIDLARPTLAFPKGSSVRGRPQPSRNRYDLSRLDDRLEEELERDGYFRVNQAVELDAVVGALEDYVGRPRSELAAPVVALQSRPTHHPNQEIEWPSGAGGWGDVQQKVRTARLAAMAILGPEPDGPTKARAKTLCTILLTSEMTVGGFQPIMGLEARIASVLLGHERHTGMDPANNVAVQQLLTPESAKKVMDHVQAYRPGESIVNEHPDWKAAQRNGVQDPWQLVARRADRIVDAARDARTRKELPTSSSASVSSAHVAVEDIGKRLLPDVYDALTTSQRARIDEILEGTNGPYPKLTHQGGRLFTEDHVLKDRALVITEDRARKLVTAVFEAGLPLKSVRLAAFSKLSGKYVKRAMQETAPQFVHDVLREHSTVRTGVVVVSPDRIDKVAGAIHAAGVGGEQLTKLRFSPDTYEALQTALKLQTEMDLGIVRGERDRGLSSDTTDDAPVAVVPRGADDARSMHLVVDQLSGGGERRTDTVALVPEFDIGPPLG